MSEQHIGPTFSSEEMRWLDSPIADTIKVLYDLGKPGHGATIFQVRQALAYAAAALPAKDAEIASYQRTVQQEYDKREALDSALAEAKREIERLKLKCAICGKEAACIGRYEGAVEFSPACDDCCGHGNEDGECFQLVNEDGDYMTVADMLGRLNQSEKELATAESGLAIVTHERETAQEQVQEWRGKVAELRERLRNFPTIQPAADDVLRLMDLIGLTPEPPREKA